MAQLHLPGMGPAPLVTKVVVAFKGTSHEMPIEIKVQPKRVGRRWRSMIVEMRRIEKEKTP